MDLKLPPLGEGADSGTVVNLFVKEGDQVTDGQPLLELENEKAVATIPATASGLVTKVFIKPGDKLSVGQRILALSQNGRTATPASPASPDRSPKTKTPAPPPEPGEGVEADAASTEPGPRSDAPVAASPAIRKLARDLGLDLSRVRGTARGGRITMEDLRGHLQRLQQLAAQPKAPAPAASSSKPPAEPVDFSRWGSVTKQPLTPLRQVIARRLTENWNAIPHVTQFDAADLTGLLALRKKYLAAYEKKGARLTVTALVLQAVVATLKRHPIFNSSLDEAAQEIVLKQYFHIGIAVDTEAGLLVPVMRDVDKKDLAQISKELEELAKKARERKVTGEELKGGTFTISNQGGIGGGHFTPIINRPEVAILGLGQGAMQAVVRENKVEPRIMLPLALSYDHRVIDGGAAARFIVDLVKALENFDEKGVRL